jgi:hypothetical protein
MKKTLVSFTIIIVCLCYAGAQELSVASFRLCKKSGHPHSVLIAGNNKCLQKGI